MLWPVHRPSRRLKMQTHPIDRSPFQRQGPEVPGFFEWVWFPYTLYPYTEVLRVVEPNHEKARLTAKNFQIECIWVGTVASLFGTLPCFDPCTGHPGGWSHTPIQSTGARSSGRALKFQVSFECYIYIPKCLTCLRISQQTSPWSRRLSRCIPWKRPTYSKEFSDI